MNPLLQRSSSQRTVILAGLIWLLVYVLTRRLLEGEQLSQGWRILVALLPLPPFAFFLVHTMTGIRALDELQRRIQLEALAIGFPVAILFFMMLGLVELAIPLSPEDWSYLPLFYWTGSGLKTLPVKRFVYQIGELHESGLEDIRPRLCREHDRLRNPHHPFSPGLGQPG